MRGWWLVEALRTRTCKTCHRFSGSKQVEMKVRSTHDRATSIGRRSSGGQLGYSVGDKECSHVDSLLLRDGTKSPDTAGFWQPAGVDSNLPAALPPCPITTRRRKWIS